MSDDFRLEGVTDLDQIVIPKRVPRVLRVPWHRTVEGVVLCDRLFKLPTHYVGKRTRLCSGKSNCEVHKSSPLRIYFLCAVFDQEEREAFWFQLPPAASKALLFGVKVLERPLFGVSVRVGRKWKDKNAPVVLHVENSTVRRVELQRPLNPDESVRRCFFSCDEKPSTNGRKAV